MTQGAQDCEAKIEITIDPKDLTREEAQALCEEVRKKSKWKETIELSAFTYANEVDDSYAVYTIDCEWTEWFDFHIGAGTHDNYTYAEYNENCTDDMAYNYKEIFESLGFPVIECEVLETDAPSYEDFLEDLRDSVEEDRKEYEASRYDYDR